MNVKSRARLGAVVGVAALALGAMAAPAVADPADGSHRLLAGVGSDTTQDVVNGLSETVDGGGTIASYDATGSATIQTRDTGCVINRPNGSSAGIDALRNAVDNNTGCLDFARSSRVPADTSTTDLTWIPFARDAVTVAVRSDSALNNNLNLTTAQLAAIYTCQTTTLNGVTLAPLLPQANSGTRSFFLGQIGVTEAQVGSCVGTMEEHDGRYLTAAGNIAPYSIAKYIAQTSGVVDDIHGATVLGKVNGVSPTNADGTLNVSFPYSRDVYDVVPTSKLSDSVINPTFVGANSSVCAETATIELYGFGAISNCGTTTLKGER
ncbi:MULTISPECIES: substrate-binding domain-containing protein [unclassified Streptomyces]|uniref:substrate-binding domain-containing protein n=1 Tax=unclassified Streptomyces TaxID=2593676 RepID=UPI0034195A8B